MRTFFLYGFLMVITLFASCSGEKSVDIYATTDVHGMLLPYDFTDGVSTERSFANISYLRDSIGRGKSIFLDNGDILQGDPLVYYYNYIDTVSEHIVPKILNYIGYDASVVGNHDIETGHAVYDRVRNEMSFPQLAANAVDETSGEPYFKPYTIIKRNGLKVLVFGLVTPAVTNWIPASLYTGIRFDNMVECAKKWMPEMKKQDADIIVGLFHSGVGDEDEDNDENGTMAVAVNVPGFDIIFAGHDHKLADRKIVNAEGDSVLILDGGSRSAFIMHASVIIKADGSKTITGENIKTSSINESKAFIEEFSNISDTLKNYTERVIGYSTSVADTRDAFFGPSSLVDLIHKLQLSVSRADISFAAPLSFDASIDSGELHVRDMFELYRFENFLYTVKMTGKEIDSYLEYSYGKWMNSMKTSSDYMLKYKMSEDGTPLMVNGTARLRNATYNFDSAMGLVYSVDLTKDEGSMVSISVLDNGKQFYPDSLYLVAVNSYRANGGGGHFKAVGITHQVLPQRLVSSTTHDFRFYMTKWIEDNKKISPSASAKWTVKPEKWAGKAKARESVLLFGEKR